MKFIKNSSILLFFILLIAYSCVTEENFKKIESDTEESAVIRIPDETKDDS